MTTRKFTTTDRTAAKPIVAMIKKVIKKKLEIINYYVNVISFEDVDDWFDFYDDLPHQQQ